METKFNELFYGMKPTAPSRLKGLFFLALLGLTIFGLQVRSIFF